MRIQSISLDRNLLTLEFAKRRDDLPRPRDVIDLGAVVSWGLTREHGDEDVYVEVSISLSSGLTHTHQVMVGRFIGGITFQPQTELIDSIIAALTPGGTP